jgi:hypothetical protein
LAPIPEGWPGHPNTWPNIPSRRATRRIGLPALGTLMRPILTHLRELMSRKGVSRPLTDAVHINQTKTNGYPAQYNH